VSGFASVNTRIASAGRTHRTGLAPVPKLLILSAILCATTIAGCARRSDPQATANAAAQSESRACRSAKALLEPPVAPDCEFRGSDSRTVDPDQFARLTLDYERECYRRAEKVARDRLRQLQASRKCEIRLVRHSPAVIQ
jgi:hypothetical protein